MGDALASPNDNATGWREVSPRILRAAPARRDSPCILPLDTARAIYRSRHCITGASGALPTYLVLQASYGALQPLCTALRYPFASWAL